MVNKTSLVNEHLPRVSRLRGNILRFKLGPFHRHRKRRRQHRSGFRDGKVVACWLDGLVVYDETRQHVLGTYRCRRKGNRLCNRISERVVLGRRENDAIADEPSRMKLVAIDDGFDKAVVCARCHVRLASQEGASRVDKRHETLTLEADDKIVVENEGLLPSAVSGADAKGRRTMSFVRDIEWTPHILKTNIAGIPDDLFDTVSAEDDDGRPALHRAFTAFWHECDRFVAEGIVPPAKSPARMSTYVCTQAVQEYVRTKYPNESVTQKRKIAVPLKRSLRRLLREYRIVFGDDW